MFGGHWWLPQTYIRLGGVTTGVSDMSPPGNTDARPLYAKVREQLVERIRSGVWKPGQLIPSEFEIAAEFGVSQGTARKAISALAAERLVMRQQGRGTFVVEHTPAHVLFRFFNMFDAAGAVVHAGQSKSHLQCGTGKSGRATGIAHCSRRRGHSHQPHSHPRGYALHQGNHYAAAGFVSR